MHVLLLCNDLVLSTELCAWPCASTSQVFSQYGRHLLVCTRCTRERLEIERTKRIQKKNKTRKRNGLVHKAAMSMSDRQSVENSARK